jgi:hypothetical protein
MKNPRSPSLPSSLKLNPATKLLDFTGEASYTATYGTSFVVTIRDITPAAAGKNALTMAPITFTIPAIPTVR